MVGGCVIFVKIRRLCLIACSTRGIRCERSGRDKTINSALKMLINQGSRGFFVKFIFSIAWSSMKLRVWLACLAKKARSPFLIITIIIWVTCLSGLTRSSPRLPWQTLKCWERSLRLKNNQLLHCICQRCKRSAAVSRRRFAAFS